MTEFVPQGTTMDTFSKTEKSLYEKFIGFGYSDQVASAIAHTFTQYMLNYLTEEGVAARLTGSGADTRTVYLLVEAFRKAKQTSHEKTHTAPVDTQQYSLCH